MALARAIVRSFASDSASLQKRLVQCFSLGQFNEALKLGLELKANTLKEHGENHPVHLHVLGSLGQIYRSLGDFDLSVSLTTEMHEKFLRQFGEQSRSTIRAKHLLGSCYTTKGAPDVALGFLQEALTLRRKYAAEETLDIVENLLELGKCYVMLGEMEKARGAVEEAKGLVGEKYGYDNILMGKVLEALAHIAEKANNPQEALTCLRTALSMHQEWYGPLHRTTIHTQSLLDQLLRAHPQLASSA